MLKGKNVNPSMRKYLTIQYLQKQFDFGKEICP